MNNMMWGLGLLLLITGQLKAQLRYTYDFSKGLQGIEEGAPPLKVLGKMGEIKDVPIKELKGNVKLAYFFEANSGLAFDNNAARGFLDKSYSVELYFMFKNLENWRRVIDFKNRKSDNGCYILNGKVNFFNFAVGENAAVRPEKYTHYIFTRDHKKNVIQIFVDGELKLEFPDKGKNATLDGDQRLNFFQDDLVVNHESSDGAVAYLRLYDEVVNPVFVRRRFRELLAHFRRDTPEEEPAEASAETPEASREDVIVTGRIYDGRDLQPLRGVELRLKTEEDSLLAVARLTSGDYRLQVRPDRAYKLGVYSAGYKPREVAIGPFTEPEIPKTHIRMEAEIFDRPLVTIRFGQGGDTLADAGAAWIEPVLDLLKARPDLGVRLEGHTDNVGDFDKNIALSWQRVALIKKILIDHQVLPERIFSQGYGPVRPVASNQSEVSRAGNRRVEVWPVHLVR